MDVLALGLDFGCLYYGLIERIELAGFVCFNSSFYYFFCSVF